MSSKPETSFVNDDRAHAEATAAATATESPTADEQPSTRPAFTVQTRLLSAIGIVAAVLIALVFPFPMEGRLWGEVFDLAHAPVFFVTLLLIVALVDPRSVGWVSGGPPLVQLSFGGILMLTILLMVIGAAGEFLQQFAGRHSNLSDVVANSAGLLGGLCWIAAISERGLRRIGLRLISVGLVALVSLPSGLDAWACLQQQQRFPQLASFEDHRELKSWSAVHSELQVNSDWSTDGNQSLNIQLRPSNYSGAAMIWFEADWRSYQTLLADVRNPNPFELQLVLKVFDRQHTLNKFPSSDRFERLMLLPANTQKKISIDLSEIADGPRNRSMDLADIRGLEFYCLGISQPATLQIDNLRLSD
ncbi:MAG: hypothetical protein Fues2KO_43340 [Fuerstiella sp.]